MTRVLLTSLLYHFSTSTPERTLVVPSLPPVVSRRSIHFRSLPVCVHDPCSAWLFGDSLLYLFIYLFNFLWTVQLRCNYSTVSPFKINGYLITTFCFIIRLCGGTKQFWDWAFIVCLILKFVSRRMHISVIYTIKWGCINDIWELQC